MFLAVRRFTIAVLTLLASFSAHGAADVRVVGVYPGFLPAHRPFRHVVSFFIVNGGPDATTSLKLEVTAPKGFALELNFTPHPAEWKCTDAGDGSMVCTGKKLEPELGTSLHFDVIAEAPPIGVHDIVGVVSEDGDPDPTNNRSAVTFTLFRNFQVTNNGDSGPGSLRAAIEEANATCKGGELCQIDMIPFDEFIVRLQSPLPPITICNLIIDTQSGYIDEIHRRIQLDGSRLQTGNGLEIRTECPAGQRGVKVIGLGIGGFPENGIVIASNDADPRPGETCHELSSNAIGLDRTSKETRPNKLRGISFESSRACADVFNNFVGGNLRSGIAVWAAAPGTQIRHNRIGWGVFPVPLGNGGSGIFIAADDIRVSNNDIAFNKEFGISIYPGVKQPGVRVNTIHSNGEIAIDWGLDRRTPNDPDETDGVPNAPRITNIVTRKEIQFGRTVTHGRIQGLLRSRTGVYGNRFTVNLYMNGAPDLSGRHEAFRLARAVDVTPNTEGTFEVAFETDIQFIDGLTFTAQLIVADDTGQRSWTSELSEPFKVP